MTSLKSDKFFWIGLFISIVFHLGLCLMRFSAVVPAKDLSSPSEIYVELQGPLNPNDSRKVVESSQALEQAKVADQSAQFLGAERNRVKEQSQAAVRGKFSEGGMSSAPSAPGDGMAALGMGDLLPFSSSPYQLDGVKEGSQTVLNTDPVLYASFMNRVTEEIYDPWSRYARQAITNPYLRKRAGASVYITKLRILINRTGEVAAIQTVQSSGFDALDEAPKKAFWELAKFENPPAQMFEADGLLKLNYEFHFELHASSFSLLPLRL